MKKAGKMLTFSAMAAGAALGLTGCGLVGVLMQGFSDSDDNLNVCVYGPPEMFESPAAETEVPEAGTEALAAAEEALTEAQVTAQEPADDPMAFDPDINMLEDVYGPPEDFD